MLNHLWPLFLIVFSNTIYQICAKSTPEKLNPFASLTITYLVGAAVSYILYCLLNHKINIIQEYNKLNWSSLVLGFMITGLEAGYIYAYKFGWKVSILPTVQSAFLAVLLLFIGLILYKEPITSQKIIGTIICITGLYIINQ